jgi:hypothetical protein
MIDYSYWQDSPTCNFFGLCIDGKKAETDYQEIVFALKKALQNQSKLSLIIYIKNLDGFSPEFITESLEFTSQHQNEIKSIAIVTNEQWKEFIQPFEAKLPEVCIQHFDPSQMKYAWRWLQELV